MSRLIDDAQMRALRANHAESARAIGIDGDTPDHLPVVKLFSVAGAARWLITECDGDQILFGLCDLGLGFPELGSVSLDELESLTARLDLVLGGRPHRSKPIPMVEQDRHFKPTKTISEYADEARQKGYIDA